MSLINDALKRAKQAQQQRPQSAAPGPQLRPVEARQSVTGRKMSPVVWILWLFLFLGIAGFMIWRSFNRKNSGQTTTATVAKPSPAPLTLASKPASTVTAVAVPTAKVQIQPAPRPAIETVIPAPAPTVAPISTVSTQPVIASASPTHAPIITPPAPPPQLAWPKLQGIFYRPDRPAALINGKTVLVGDQIGEFRVMRIEQGSATLVCAGQTNVLKLPQ